MMMVNERTDELHQNDDTQGIRRMMQGSSNNLIPSLRGIDALKVKGTVSEFSDVMWNIRKIQKIQMNCRTS